MDEKHPYETGEPGANCGQEHITSKFQGFFFGYSDKEKTNNCAEWAYHWKVGVFAVWIVVDIDMV